MFSVREADMDWSDLAKTVIALGAPAIGQALAGPLGAAAGHLLAQALGASEATPSAVNEAIVAASPNAAAAAALLAEQKWAMAFGAQADAAKAQVVAVGETQRAEMASDDLLQRWWRPLYALELSMLECPAFAAAVLHVLWTGFVPGINGFATLSGLLMAYFAARFGVLGVYVSGRSREKQAAVTGQPVPGVVGQVVKAVTRK
jgi:hypothetical protein